MLDSIAGCVAEDHAIGESSLKRILAHEDELLFAKTPIRIVQSRGAAFGVVDHGSRPSPPFSSDVCNAGGGNFLLAFQGRINNRDEVSAWLERRHDPVDSYSDSDVFRAAFAKAGVGAVDRIVGDYVAAIWDRERSELTLYAAPLARRTLFWWQNDRLILFGTSADMLLRHGGVPRLLDVVEAARFATGLAPMNQKTLFSGLRAVGQGCALRFRGGACNSSRRWDPRDVPAAAAKDARLASELRETLKAAVGNALERPWGAAASQLSGGRDSAAVTAIAASLSARLDDRLVALTAAPSLDFSAEDPLRISDESRLAATVAKRYGNIEHHVVRPGGEGFLRDLRSYHEHSSWPTGNPANLPWWMAMMREASSAGASIMLEGSFGNDTISAGGPSALGDFVRATGLGALPALAHMLAKPNVLRRRTIAKQLVGPYLPRFLFNRVQRAFASAETLPFSGSLLREPHRTLACDWLAGDEADERPSTSYHDQRCETFVTIETGDDAMQRLFGIDCRDPTADRRVVEFCLSLPPDALFSADGGRPLFERAFAADLPGEILASRRRGFQSPNWIDLFPPEPLRLAFRKLARNPVVDELLDLAAIERRLDSWPRTGGHRIENLTRYRRDVLGALAVADFIDTHFPA